MPGGDFSPRQPRLGTMTCGLSAIVTDSLCGTDRPGNRRQACRLLRRRSRDPMNSDPRHRAHHHQLWIDKVRAEMDSFCSPAQLDQSYKMQALAILLGWGLNDASIKRVCALPRNQLAFEFVKHDLVDPLPAVALRALKARGYPQRELTPTDWPACEAKVGYA